jgi:hypothetical protein
MSVDEVELLSGMQEDLRAYYARPSGKDISGANNVTGFVGVVSHVCTA